MNCKGQAALVDSIFFLTIVSIVCTTLFFFAINYGLSTESQINSFYSKDFSSDLLKVITYVSIPRDEQTIGESQLTGIFQSDYLLALIKEDYSDKRKMSPLTTKAIVRTLDSVVKPFDASIDYAFFLTSESDNEYLFLLLATHECSNWVENTSGNLVCDVVQRKYFYCEPTNQKILEERIFPKLNRVDNSVGKITLSESERSDSQGRPFIIGFSGWIVVDIPELKQDFLLSDNDFNCELTMPN